MSPRSWSEIGNLVVGEHPGHVLEVAEGLVERDVCVDRVVRLSASSSIAVARGSSPAATTFDTSVLRVSTRSAHRLVDT